MIKIEKINSIIGLCGRYISNEKTNRVIKIESINITSYTHNTENKYFLSDKDSVVISGTEHEIIIALLGWTLV